MKFGLFIVLTIMLSSSCQKNDTTADQGSAPNTSPAKDGSSAGTSSTGSLGSSNP